MIGWIGSFLLAICGAEEAYKAWKTKQCNIGWFMLTTWYIGELCTLSAIMQDAPLGYLLFNYGLNVICITVMIIYKRNSL